MSLLQYFSSDPLTVINDFKMSVSHPQYEKITLYVEGQSDVMLFRNLINEDVVKLIPLEGKRNVIDVMKGLYSDYSDRVCAVCDADFDHIKGKAQNRLAYGVLITDYHDIEVMMLFSSAFRKIINQKAINNNTGFSDKMLREIIDACKVIGIFRLINLDNNFGLRFKALTFNEFIIFENKCLSIDMDALLDELLASSSTSATKQILINLYNQYSSLNHDVEQLCCGHDCSNVLAVYLRKSDNIQGNKFNRDRVEKDLMLAFNEHAKYSIFNNIMRLAS